MGKELARQAQVMSLDPTHPCLKRAGVVTTACNPNSEEVIT